MMDCIILYCVMIFSIFLSVYGISTHECFCYIESSVTNNTEANNNSVTNLLSCSLVPQNIESNYYIPCQRVDKFICVGPINPIKLTTNSVSTKQEKLYIQNLTIAPWGLSNLFLNNMIETLQLDMMIDNSISVITTPTTTTTTTSTTTNSAINNHNNISYIHVDALNMGGLDSLKILLARTFIADYDSCSFVHLINLEQITLNCQSKFPNYLTFNKSIKMIRFVGCENVRLQFDCINCIQDKSINIIRIRPGPILRKHLIKFTQFIINNNWIENNNYNNNNSFLLKQNFIHLNKCTPDICSDMMLCRDNMALNKVRLKIGQPIKPIIEEDSNNAITENSELLLHNLTTSIPTTTTATTKTTNTNTSIINTSSSIVNGTILNEMEKIVNNNNNQTYAINNNASNGNKQTNYRMTYKIWIVCTILILIIASLFTLCMIIVWKHQRKQKLRTQFTRSKLVIRNTNLPNGKQNYHEILLKPEINNNNNSELINEEKYDGNEKT